MDDQATAKDSEDNDPARVREAMVAELQTLGVLNDGRVADAFRAVKRERFAPGAPVPDVYAARTAVVTKRDEHGVAVSSVSAPEIQAFMLEQAEIRSGMRVLEIGSGGYQAALIAELVGPDGTVTTVDIDPDVTTRASQCLSAAGYPQVKVVLADAEAGVPDGPWDRIIVTVGAWDIPPAWTTQLAEAGRLVVPLRMRGLTRSLALDRDGDRLVSRSAKVCGFVKIRGEGAHQEQLVLLRGRDVGLRFDDGRLGDLHQLDGVLATTRAQAWSAVTVGPMESFDTLQFWLATTLPDFCLLRTVPGGERDLVDPGNRLFSPASVLGDSVAYLVSRRTEDGMVELGAHAFGPHARPAAEAMADQVIIWDQEQRHRSGPMFTVWPAITPDERITGDLVITKRHRRIAVSWPI